MTKGDFFSKYQNANQDSIKGARTKFGYAASKVCNLNLKLYESIVTAMQKIEVDKCSVDEKGNMVYRTSTGANGQPTEVLVYTPTKLIEKNAEIAALMAEEMEVEPETFFCTDVELVKRLHPSFSIFAGFLYDEKIDIYEPLPEEKLFNLVEVEQIWKDAKTSEFKTYSEFEKVSANGHKMEVVK